MWNVSSNKYTTQMLEERPAKERVREKGQRERKSEDKGISSARDLLMGFRRWEWNDVLFCLDRSHNGRLRLDTGVSRSTKNTEKRRERRGTRGQCMQGAQAQFNSTIIYIAG